jgi:hypothetical protein
MGVRNSDSRAVLIATPLRVRLYSAAHAQGAPVLATKTGRQKLLSIGNKTVPIRLTLLRCEAGRNQDRFHTSCAIERVFQFFTGVERILVKPRASQFPFRQSNGVPVIVIFPKPGIGRRLRTVLYCHRVLRRGVQGPPAAGEPARGLAIVGRTGRAAQ